MGDHDLASRRSGWSRSSGRASSRRSRRSARRWELALHADRRGHRHAATCAPSTTASSLGEIPRASTSPTRRRATGSSRRRAPPAPEPPRAGRPAARARAARAARLAEHPLARVDLRALRPPRRLAHRAPARPRRGRAAAAAVAARARGLARRAGPGRRARRRAPAARSPCSRRRATSPAPAASRSGSPTASTSATRRSREIAWELAEAIEGMARAAEALGIPVVSGQRLALQRDRRPRDHPAPVVGCVGLVPDVRAVPGRWREGDASLARRRAGALRSPGPSTRRSTADRAGRAANLDLAAEARWSSSSGARRRSCRSRTTSSAGGLAVALAEAALWSGVGAELDLDGDELALVRRGRRPGGVACAPEDVAAARRRPAPTQIGAVGGDRLLGVPLARSRAGLEGRLACAASSASAPPTATSPGSRTSACTRSSTAARSRPGSPSPNRGHLTVLREMGLVAQVFNEQNLSGLRRPARDRPHALLDDRLGAVVERAADRPARPRAHGRARAQRQPRQRRRAARRAGRRRRQARRRAPTPS